MNREQIIQAFHQVSVIFDALSKKSNYPGAIIGITQQEYEKLQLVIRKEKQYNGWFTEESVCSVLEAWSKLLRKDALEKWLKPYSYSTEQKKVALIMAGNIPMVGFHDLLCVLLSGHHAIVKLSSDDQRLIPEVIHLLNLFAPKISNRVEFVLKLKEYDAVIATGSNNSLRYFEHYFGAKPHVFRKNRTSIAVLTGEESKEELVDLGKDLFTYFGLGCRNVSQLLLPVNFELNRIFEAILPYSEIINHHKYANNYDYNRAVFLLNKVPVLENGFVLLKESKELHSPLAVINYCYYTDSTEVDDFIQTHKDSIQAIVGKNYIPFGKAQEPDLSDYADAFDTMEWLHSL